MAKILDLNGLQIPTLELIFADANRTTIHVTAPTEALINEMESWVRSGLEPLAAGDKASVETAYNLLARLLSCNKEFVSLTGADLRTQYNVDIWALIHIANGYVDFISEIKNEKN